ncbi:hypothetical protein GGX14DRAFT_563028 [Mycena pura]|uniref:Insertion element IS150 protein InsJ-like helix-turn-helix domain-containing protein n=1 Tax=Mycena pura TaxID=153505 RepID=A0AAD6VN36_9AGAR|nr:hypothetical protein GGX14DRAFT_563028 [Mycena pura]
MPRHIGNTQLDSPLKNRFIGAVQTHHNIARAARKYGINANMGYKLWKKFQETGATANKHRRGRPALFSTPEKAQIVAHAVANHRKPFRDIGNEITPQASEPTIRCLMAKDGYQRRVARKVPYLSCAAKA